MADSHRVTITQIMPAAGWRAVHAVRPDSPNGPPVEAMPLVGWALVTHEGCCKDTYMLGKAACRQELRALTATDLGVVGTDDDDNLIGFLGPGEEPFAWMLNEARSYLAKQEAANTAESRTVAHA